MKKKLFYLLFALSICIPTYGQTVIERGENYEKIDLGNNQYQMIVEGDIENFKDDDDIYKPVDISESDSVPVWAQRLGFTHYYKKNKVRVFVDVDTGKFRIYPKRKDNVSYLEIAAKNPTQVNVEVVNNRLLKVYKDTTNVEYSFLISSKGFKVLYKLKNATGAANFQKQLKFKLTGGLSRTGRQIKYNGNIITTMSNAHWYDSGDDDTRKTGNVGESINDATEIATLSLNPADLAGVTYPVYVDPDLPTLGSGADTFIDSFALTTPHGSLDYISISNAATQTRRGIGKVDFSSLDNTATITNVQAIFNHDFNVGAGGYTVWMDRLLRTDWTENAATWSVYKASTSWGTVGAANSSTDYTTSGRVTATLPAVDQDITFNPIAQFQWAQANNAEVWNYSLRFDSVHTDTGRCSFASKEDATAAKRPRFIITYTLPAEETNNIYVATTGNDTTGNGTSSLPYKTIQKGVDVAVAGKTVVVRNGTYSDFINYGSYTAAILTKASGNSGNWITIKAENKWGASIDGIDRTKKIGFIFNTNHNYVKIEGFVIRNLKETGILVNSANHDITAHNNKFEHIGELQTSTAYGQAGIYTGSSVYNITVTGNWFEDIGRDGTVPNRDHGIYIGGAVAPHDFYIANNIFVNKSAGWCIQIQPSSGIVASDLTITNNTFHKPNTQRNGQIVLNGQVDNLLIQNNIFYQPRTSAINMGTNCTGRTNITLRNNITDVSILSDNGSGGVNTCSATVSNNVLSTNPLMIDPTGGNYKLQSGSPARDTGFATSSPSTDFDGVTRPYNTSYDKGAYEYSLAPSISFSAPASGGVQVTAGNNATITYIMTSPNLATMQLFWDNDESGGDGVSIVGSLAEGTDVNYLWDTTGKNGVYYIYGTATDNLGNVTTTYAPGAFTINPAGNTPPVAGDDSGSTSGSNPVVINLTANDTDSDGIADPTIALATGYLPFYGTLDFHPTNGTVTYTPTDYVAINSGAVDTFRYTVEDTLGALSNAALVTVTITGVNTPPVANNDSMSAFFGRSSIFNVLGNDTDAGGSLDSTSVAIVSNATRGTTNVNSTTGIITYTPFFAFGVDSFTYTVRDDLNTISNIAMVNIIINSVSGWTQSYSKSWFGGWK